MYPLQLFKVSTSYSPNEKPSDELDDAAALAAAALEPCSRIPDRTLALSICEHMEGKTTTYN